MRTAQVVRVDVTRNDRIPQEGPDHDQNQAAHYRRRIYAGRHHTDCPSLRRSRNHAPVTLRVAAIEYLVPPCTLRMTGVGQMLGDNALRVRPSTTLMLDYGCGREAPERCQGRESSQRVKAPPKGPIVFGPLRRLPLGQPTELGVDRLGDSNGRHHHEHNKYKPGPCEALGGAAAVQGEYCRSDSGDHAEDWHHRIRPKQ